MVCRSARPHLVLGGQVEALLFGPEPHADKFLVLKLDDARPLVHLGRGAGASVHEREVQAW